MYASIGLSGGLVHSVHMAMCVGLNVNGGAYWVNRSVHGCNGHENVYIIVCMFLRV